jgi:DNA-binding beta-propeller fold protein YncE
MAEVARTETCVMPHGSRVNRQGTKQYSACMMDELLVEIDVATGAVARRFSVAKGREGPVHHASAAAAGHGDHSAQECSPTWAHPSPDGRSVFVACNRSHEVLEIDAEGWTLRRRIATGEAPYNLDVTPDGRLLIVTLKNRTAPATEVIELASGRSLARVPNSTTLPHGIAITPDSRWAFVSVEGVGSEPGRVDAIDLAALRRVATAEVGQQATGIAVMPAR